MADNTNDDLSMEDILSSIKNILAEDEAGTKPAAAEKNAAPDHQSVPEKINTVEEAEVEIEDDILDLSPSMKIDNGNDEINLDAELNNISGKAEDITLADTAEAEELSVANDRSIDLDAELNDSSPLFTTENNQTEEFSENEESDPVYMDENPHRFLGDVLQNESQQERPDFTQDIEDAVLEPQIHDVEMEEAFDNQEISNPADSIHFENEEDAADDTSYIPSSENVSQANDEQEHDNHVYDNQEVLQGSENDFQNPIMESQPIPAYSTEPQTDAVDVSASIISNFAKMFSKGNTESVENQPANIEAPVEIIKELGDGSKTIEDVVAGVIRNIIGDEVAKNWNQGIDYGQLAKEEINRQTKLWLDKNLPVIVEKTVKQEIERVMAKVGVSQ